MMMRFAVVVVGALALGACVATGEPEQNACGAEGMQDLIGQHK